MGLNPVVQEATPTLESNWLPTFHYVFTADVKNIIVRIIGKNNTKAVLIAGHYDSISTGLNASDGGSVVGMILEMARALQSGPPLENDVIFLLTDSEENMLLGAKAFVDWHPWAKNIGVVLHFVARGTSGPAIMFETSPENGWLIQEFAQSAPHPVANSLTYTVYQLLPNDTDFRRYKAAGWPGLNFAYIDDPVHYHTMLDNPANLSERSLQHEGAQALALTRRLGNVSLENIKKSSVVYFDILGTTLVYYPQAWVLALMSVIILVYLGVIAIGIKKGWLAFGGIGAGTLALLLTALGALAFTALVEQVILAVHGQYKLMFLGNLYNSRLYLVSFVSFTIAITSVFYQVWRRKIQWPNLATGGLSVWLILAMASSLYLPVASYLFVWPLLFSLLAWGVAFILGREPGKLGRPNWIIFSLCAIPAFILAIPIVYFLYVTLPPLSAGGLAVTVLVVLLLGLLVEYLALFIDASAWLLPSAAIIIGVGFIVAGSLTAGFDVAHPQPSSIFYGFNADTGKAVWISLFKPDRWTTQFFAQGATLDTASDYFALNKSIKFMVGQAPAASVPPPDVMLLQDDVHQGVRKMRLRIVSLQPASSLTAYVSLDPSKTLSARLDGMGTDIKIKPGDQWLAIEKYGYSPSSGTHIELALETVCQPVKLFVISVQDGLPQVPDLSLSSRPADMIPSSWGGSESAIIRRSFEFPQTGCP
jgi:hypothetical protein